LVAGFVWLVQDSRLSFDVTWLAWIMFAITLYAGCSMVSNAPFYSGKSFALTKSVPFWVILLLVLAFVFVSSDPPVVLFGLFILYGLSGWVIWLWRVRKARLSNFKPSDKQH